MGKAAYYDGEVWLVDSLLMDANCFSPDDGWAQPFPHIAQVGLSKGPNGTYDQQGNVAEWVENSTGDGVWKLALGGSLIRPKEFAYCGVIEGDDPNKSISTFGFRVCKALGDQLNSSPNILQDTIENSISNSVNTLDSAKVLDKLGTVYVHISDPNNPGDPINQYKGSVAYEYYIAQTELSNTQYCSFLNAVAVVDDPYNLLMKIWRLVLVEV